MSISECSNPIERYKPINPESIKTRQGLILERYIQENTLVPTDGIDCANPRTSFSVVVAAHNEERTIAATLKSINEASQGRAEIIVGDNNSTDRTKEVTLELGDRLESPVSVLDCPIQGCAPTRQQIINEVIAQHYSQDPHGQKKRYIVLQDADTIVPPDWITEIDEAFKETNASMVTNLYKYPAWVDQTIADRTNIENFFGQRADIVAFLARNDCVQLRTNGVNTAIDMAAYAEIGGITLELTEEGELNHSDTQLGVKIRERGQPVAQHTAIVYTSPRRVLESLSRNVAYKQESDLKLVLPEDHDDETLLEIMLENLSPADLIKHRISGDAQMISDYIIIPRLKNTLSLDPLINLFGPQHPFVHALTQEISQTNDQSSLKEIKARATIISNQHGEALIESIVGKMSNPRQEGSLNL